MVLRERDGVQHPVQNGRKDSPVARNLLSKLGESSKLQKGGEVCLVQRLKLFVRRRRQKRQGRVLEC